MTQQRHDLDRMLTAWLDDPYTPPAPHYLGQVLEQTRRTRQRPAWTNPERWIPMADRIPRPAAAGPMRIAWFLIVALLVVALVAGAAVVGSQLLRSIQSDGLDSAVAIPQGDAAVLAFASLQTGTDIYTVRADGTDLRQLTSGPGVETAPAFSPDGRSIAYRVWQGGNDSLVVMDAGGGNPRTLATNGSTGNYCVRGEIAWSPDGSSLIFPVSSTCDLRFDLFIVAADGSRPATKLLAEGTDSLHPAWSPDGTQIAIVGGDTGGGVELYLVDAGPGGALSGGLTARRIATSSGDLANSGAAIQWSPDGTKLAIGSEAGDVVIIGADGSGSRVLAQGAFSPRWSPDGRRVAFHRTLDPSEGPCTVRTWVIDADGTNERRLEDLGICDAPPRWSPDGTRLSGALIASTAEEPTLGPHLGIITVDGSKPTVILPDGGSSVSWQPVAAPLPPPSPATSPSP